MTKLTRLRRGRHRWRQPLRTSGLTTLIFVLAVCWPGYGVASRLLPAPAGSATAARVPANAEAALAVTALQRRYGASSYVATRSWQSANALGATIDYMRASGSREFLDDLSRTFRAHHDRDGFLNSYYDDEGWWALTWIDAYDLTGNGAYLSQAKDIFADMTRGWDGTCSGGIWWSKARRYKNAIANELFLQVAAALHIRSPGDTSFATWAAREWAWFKGTGMLTTSHLVIDGLADCKPALSSPAWTYNQGVLIGGLVSLARMTGQGSLLTTAEQTADAVVGSSALSPRGILRDPCEPSACGLDAPLFKGIFMKNLKQLSDLMGGSYQAYLRHNALAIWSDDRRGDEFGLLWGGPFDSASTARQTSALDVLNTQVNPGLPVAWGRLVPCDQPFAEGGRR
jgi:predicted alpha-1,6-mannanase (GH76 family)